MELWDVAGLGDDNAHRRAVAEQMVFEADCIWVLAKIARAPGGFFPALRQVDMLRSTRLRSNGKHMNMTRKLSLEAAQQILDPRSLPLSHGANYVHLVASIDGLTEEVLALDPARQPAILAPDMVGVSQTRAGSAHLR